MPPFFLKDTATTEIYTLSYTTLFRSRGSAPPPAWSGPPGRRRHPRREASGRRPDRKSTRLNSSHGYISYAAFFFKGYGDHRDLHSFLHDALPISRFSAATCLVRAARPPQAPATRSQRPSPRSEEHTSELQSRLHLLCRLFF